MLNQSFFLGGGGDYTRDKGLPYHMILVREASSELGKGFSAILNWTVHFLSSICSECTFVHTVYEVGLPVEAFFLL